MGAQQNMGELLYTYILYYHMYSNIHVMVSLFKQTAWRFKNTWECFFKSWRMYLDKFEVISENTSAC
jgi:hypothetical protein